MYGNVASLLSCNYLNNFPNETCAKYSEINGRDIGLVYYIEIPVRNLFLLLSKRKEISKRDFK